MPREVLGKWEKKPDEEGMQFELAGFAERAGVRTMTKCEILRLTAETEKDSPSKPSLAVVFHSKEGTYMAPLRDYAEVVKSTFGLSVE